MQFGLEAVIRKVKSPPGIKAADRRVEPYRPMGGLFGSVEFPWIQTISRNNKVLARAVPMLTRGRGVTLDSEPSFDAFAEVIA